MMKHLGGRRIKEEQVIKLVEKAKMISPVTMEKDRFRILTAKKMVSLRTTYCQVKSLRSKQLCKHRLRRLKLWQKTTWKVKILSKTSK